MNLNDRKTEIEGLPGYVSGSLVDTTNPAGTHTLTYQVQGKQYEIASDGTKTEIGPAPVTNIKETWRIYNEGTDDEYIEIVV